jgi:hypothetical protein
VCSKLPLVFGKEMDKIHCIKETNNFFKFLFKHPSILLATYWNLM